ncbi:MAG: Tol-Pal system beta propeller repeat protein TolB [Halomonadaceae bacterium]|nr:MAG: Tol-Pal system beta propeller repeat protein TolB [Halomonadaceae bacterium]
MDTVRPQPGTLSRPWAGFAVAALLLLLTALPARAELVIQVTEGADRGIPIAVVPFAVSSGEEVPEEIATIIRNNLTMSGDFQLLEPGRMLSLPTFGDTLHYRDWRLLGQQFVMLGSLERQDDGRYVLEYELYDVSQQRRLIRSRATASRQQLRQMAHHVSNRVYETVTGIDGIFTTRLAFVTRTREGGDLLYRLRISDIDGVNPVTLLESDEPILSPDWSPDGKELVYVSFEGGRPGIYRQTIASGERERLTEFRGLNSAPVWSPDGKSLLMTLSKDGSADIYRMVLGSRNVEQLTRHWAINTEASWAPDGRSFVYTSDRSGSPQIYQMDRRSGDSKRLTFEGNYNASAQFSPDGKSLYFVHGRDRQFFIGMLDLESGNQRILHRTPTDEAPGIAPNGRLLIYVTRQGNSRSLELTTTDGRSQFRLPIEHEGIRDPAWSPLP